MPANLGEAKNNKFTQLFLYRVFSICCFRYKIVIICEKLPSLTKIIHIICEMLMLIVKIVTEKTIIIS